MYTGNREHSAVNNNTMASFMFETDSEMAPFSPASSISLMSVGSDNSPAPSPSSPDHSQTYPRYQNIYEERLQPLKRAVSEARPMPQPTHQVSYNPSIQARFNNALQNNDISELQDILQSSSDNNNIDINLYNQDGQTPIQQACMSGQLAIVQLMIRFGADPNLRSRDGWATLHLASFYGNSEILQYIILCSKR